MGRPIKSASGQRRKNRTIRIDPTLETAVLERFSEESFSDVVDRALRRLLDQDGASPVQRAMQALAKAADAEGEIVSPPWLADSPRKSKKAD